MSGIYGLVRKDGGPVPEDVAVELGRGMTVATPMLATHVHRGPCCLGIVSRPLGSTGLQPPQLLHTGGTHFVIDARLDGKAGLTLALGGSTPKGAADPVLVAQAFLAWGIAGFDRLLGDWSAAAWDPAERRLIVARELCGLTPLFFFDDPQWFVFATRLEAIAFLPIVKRVIDEEYVATMYSTGRVPAARTGFEGISWIRPGYAVESTISSLRSHQYGTVRTDPIAIRDRREAADGLLHLLTEAVSDRVDSCQHLGLTLSGGLDSGSIAAIAGPLIRARGRTLQSLTHVPQFSDFAVGVRIGDESPFAAATAEAAGLPPTRLIDSATTSPIAAIERVVQLTCGIHLAAAHSFYLLDLFAAAADAEVQLLLTGQSGNQTLSWQGPMTGREQILRLIRRRLQSWRYASLPANAGHRVSLLNHRFADRTEVFSRIAAARKPQRPVMFERRMDAWNELSAPHPFRVSDPTLDRRVVEYCWSIDPRFYRGPRGEPRWLVRTAMADRLPASVLRGEGRGRQAADMLARLRAVPVEVEASILACEQHDVCRQYLNISTLHLMWRRVQAENTEEARRDAGFLLCSGLQLGCFLRLMSGAVPC